MTSDFNDFDELEKFLVLLEAPSVEKTFAVKMGVLSVDILTIVEMTEEQAVRMLVGYRASVRMAGGFTEKEVRFMYRRAKFFHQYFGDLLMCQAIEELDPEYVKEWKRIFRDEYMYRTYEVPLPDGHDERRAALTKSLRSTRPE